MFDTNTELAALDEVLTQDALDYAAFEDQANYQDAVGPRPPATGNYELKIEKSALRKGKDGKPILDGPEKNFPIFGIQSATIVGESLFTAAEGQTAVGGGLGEGKSRKVGLLQDVRTQPFQRNGQSASSFIDLLRSFDVTQANVPSIRQGLELLADFINQGKTFRVRLDWFAEDYQARNKELAKHGDTPAEQKAKLSKEAYNQIYDRYRVRSMHKFEKQANGLYNPIWTSPAGTPIEARLQIVRYYASTDTVRLGAEGTN